jgi:hypothetical protein
LLTSRAHAVPARWTIFTMQIAIVTFDGFNELDSFIALAS